MPEKLVKVSKMNLAANWSSQIADIAGPYQGNRKGWLGRAAYKADVTFRQVKALYYGETTNPRFDVAEKIITAAEQARNQKAKRDALMVADYFDRHAEALAVTDEEFHRDSIDAFREVARVISGRDRT